MRKQMNAAVGITALTLVTAGAWGQYVTEMPDIYASDGQGDDYFGTAVAIDGDWAVITAHRDDDNGANSGSVYFFERAADRTWIEIDKFTQSDVGANEYFGWSCAIEGSVAVVSSKTEESSRGAIFIYERIDDEWTFSQRLQASDEANSDEFGRSLAISDGRILVGAPYNDDAGSNSGSAYLFAPNRDGGTWSQIAKFIPDDGQQDDYFGWSVALDGDRAVIGALNEDDLGSNAGAA